MTKDQIDELMRENGIVVVGEAVYVLCNLVEKQSAETEREACAKLCIEMASWHGDLVTAAYDSAADAIRARGQE